MTSRHVPVSVLSSRTKDKQLKKFWVQCTDSDVLFTSVNRFLQQVDKTYGDYVKHKTDISPSIGNVITFGTHLSLYYRSMTFPK